LATDEPTDERNKSNIKPKYFTLIAARLSIIGLGKSAGLTGKSHKEFVEHYIPDIQPHVRRRAVTRIKRTHGRWQYNFS